MAYRVLGLQKLDYTNKENRHIEGIKLHCYFPAKGVDGVAADSFFISPMVENVSTDLIGKDVDFFYNRYGKITDVIPVESKK